LEVTKLSLGERECLVFYVYVGAIEMISFLTHDAKSSLFPKKEQ
jgi:hypothetical protein